jgi:hypothetical protein
MSELPEFRIGQLAERLHGGYLAHHALITIARDPRAAALVPPVEPGQAVPVGRIPWNDNPAGVEYHFTHYLAQATEVGTDVEYSRVWLCGALLTLGDELAAYDYFDRAPELEMVRHLRNAAAHGNRFDIRNPEGLARFPAHTRHTIPKLTRADGACFEITPDLHAQAFLFEYMDAPDVLTLFQAVGRYLLRVADGLPGHGNSVEGSRSAAAAARATGGADTT